MLFRSGHGLGSMLSGLFRSAMPMIKRGLAFFGKQALKTSLQVVNEVAHGESFGNSARRHVPEVIKCFASNANFSNQSGSDKRGRKRNISSFGQKKNKTKSKKTRRKQNSCDIFDA